MQWETICCTRRRGEDQDWAEMNRIMSVLTRCIHCIILCHEFQPCSIADVVVKPQRAGDRTLHFLATLLSPSIAHMIDRHRKFEHLPGFRLVRETTSII